MIADDVSAFVRFSTTRSKLTSQIMAFAKTGHWFGMELYGVAPDIMVISKDLTCGYLPMGAVIYTDRIYQTAMNFASTKMMMSDV